MQPTSKVVLCSELEAMLGFEDQDTVLGYDSSAYTVSDCRKMGDRRVTCYKNQ